MGQIGPLERQHAPQKCLFPLECAFSRTTRPSSARIPWEAARLMGRPVNPQICQNQLLMSARFSREPRLPELKPGPGCLARALRRAALTIPKAEVAVSLAIAWHSSRAVESNRDPTPKLPEKQER